MRTNRRTHSIWGFFTDALGLTVTKKEDDQMDENQQVDVAIDAPSEQEKTLTQSQVNEIVGREKAKAKREA